MDTMQIGSLSMAMSMVQLKNEASVAILKNVMDTQTELGGNMMQMLSTLQVPAMPDIVGANFDMSI